MRWIKAAALALVAPVMAFGQVMADRLPPETVFYVGFRGGDALAPAYEKSRLKALVEATDLRQLVSERFHNRIADMMDWDYPEVSAAWPELVAAAKRMWQYPCALWVTPAGDTAQVYVAADAGDSAAALADELRKAAGVSEVVKVVQVDRYVVVTHRDHEVGQLARNDRALALAPRFRAAMQQIDADGAAVIYMDFAGVMARATEPDAKRAMSDLGADQVTTVSASMGFAGENWQTRAFIPLPRERSGVLALSDGEALSDETLRLVPATAAGVHAMSLDIERLLREARATYGKIEPGGEQAFDRALSMAWSGLGMDLQAALLPHLGREWVMFTDANVGGIQPMGFVVANRLRDPAKAEAALLQLQQKLLTFARAGAEFKQMSIPLVVTDHRGMKIRTVSLPMVSPSWLVRDGVLYMALYPQPIMAAADLKAAGAATFADAPSIKAWRARHGTNPASLNYQDLPQLLPSGYATLMFWSRFMGIADLQTGLETPVVAVPPLGLLKRHAGPTLRAIWNDEAGWHLMTTEPFPGAQLSAAMMTTDVSTYQVPLMVSVLLPSLTRAREKANQVKCASNLRQIGQGCMLAASDRRGLFADTLGDVAATQQISPEVFLCPSRGGVVPAHILTGSKEAIRDWVNDNADYEYLGKGLRLGGNPDFVVAYERIDAHAHEGGNVLYADGRVEFVLAEDWDDVITEALNQQ